MLLVLFLVALVVTLMYYDDPHYYQKGMHRQMKKYRKQMCHWQDYIHDMMPVLIKTLSKERVFIFDLAFCLNLSSNPKKSLKRAVKIDKIESNSKMLIEESRDLSFTERDF